MKIFLTYTNTLLSVVFALIIVKASGFAGKAETKSFELEPPAERQDVYIFGNSMFGTGIDLDIIRKSMPSKTIEFAYYNGYYTSMWHLGVSLAMEVDNAPNTVVWGFRPTYAIRPAFRQNIVTVENDFSTLMPNDHRETLINAGDYSLVKGDSLSQTITDPDDTSSKSSLEPFESLAWSLAETVKSPFAALNGEVDVLNNTITQIFSTFKVWTGDTESGKPTDLLIEYVSNGNIQKADALVIDSGKKFITGKKVKFQNSFVPKITEKISALGAEQVVIIFRPVNSYDEGLEEDIAEFYKEAQGYFEENNVRVIDMLSDDDLKRNMYASGDHFNQAGRELISNRVIDALTE